MKHCEVCGVMDKPRNMVPIIWDLSQDGMELYTDLWTGYAHRQCVEDHNENSGRPFYTIRASHTIPPTPTPTH